ncbi:MAG: hypothetical protein II839_04115 [Kiritimatiellae bacterium]|nr:hypothetical protein [Kiritimatiellia bacterium]
MKPELLRLFLPVGAGVLLGLFFAFRGFFRARAGVPGFVQLLAGLTGASPVTKLFYAAILAFVAAAPASNAGEPVFQPATVFFVAGNVMGLMAFAQGLVAAARMPKMLASPTAETSFTFLGPGGKGGAIPVTMIIQGFLETPAIFAMIGGIVALQMTN